jgi:hypothetical protein
MRTPLASHSSDNPEVDAPDDAQALEALRTLRAWLAGPATPTTYTQVALPPGITRDGYMRRHRVRMRARVDGWTRCGQARLVSASAWQTDVESETASAAGRPRHLRIVPQPLSLSDELDRALGISTN